MKNKYDSSVVFLYNTGNEHVLPPEFRRQIPYATISTWRKTDYSKYRGHEFRRLFHENLNNAELILENQRMKNAFRAFARSWVTLSSTLVPIIKKAQKDKELQGKVIRAVNYMRRHVGLERSLKMVGLSKTLYYHWVLEARFDCFDSFTSLCSKRHPQQLQVTEIRKIKKLLLDPEFDHWPIVSIASLALRKKNLVASLYSWYKYARLWDITKKPFKKRLKTKGLIATCPNEYLHVDTTFYPLIDGKNICISFVMDNYSKMILGYHVSYRNTFEIVRQSMTRALETIAKHPDVKNGGHSFMVTDGGKENHNHNIDGFISRLTKHKITKIKALKDIRFSNSPVEAVHRTIKGRYLRSRKFESIEALSKYLEWVVMDYNTLRPHYKHRPLTPHEVYFNIPLNFDIRKRTRNAMKKRVMENKNSKCIQCQGFSYKKYKATCDGSCPM